MESNSDISGYKYADSATNESHGYLVPAVLRTLKERCMLGARVFDLGCGNGSVSEIMHRAGYSVCGVDPSEEGISQAHAAYPYLNLSLGSAYDDLVSRHGTFDAVVSLEVVEHVYSPRKYAATVRSLLKPGGVAIISTPYHSYLKNVAIAVTGKMDNHFTALWDHGHIKFWSFRTLSTLLNGAGFSDVHFLRVGRIPILAKSMIAVATAR